MPFQKGHTYGRKPKSAPALAESTIEAAIPYSPDLKEKIEQAQKGDRVAAARIPKASIQEDMLQRYVDIGGASKKLAIPIDVQTAYQNAGWALKWVRYVDPKTKLTDFSQIAKYHAMQGSIVSYRELSELDPEFAASKQRGNLTDMTGSGGALTDAVTVGSDLLLMRYPAVIDAKLREQVTEETRRQRQETVTTAKQGNLIVSDGKIDSSKYFE
jgi:hypothetical protein